MCRLSAGSAHHCEAGKVVGVQLGCIALEQGVENLGRQLRQRLLTRVE